MSLNATIQGEINFSSEENYNKGVDRLKSNLGGLFDEWVESGKINLDDENLKVVIGYGNYKNLVRHVDDVFEYANGGKVVSVCFDGMAKGYVDTPNNSSEYDLESWSDNYPDETLMEVNFDKYVDEQSKVMNEFFREFM